MPEPNKKSRPWAGGSSWAKVFFWAPPFGSSRFGPGSIFGRARGLGASLWRQVRRAAIPRGRAAGEAGSIPGRMRASVLLGQMAPSPLEPPYTGGGPSGRPAWFAGPEAGPPPVPSTAGFTLRLLSPTGAPTGIGCGRWPRLLGRGWCRAGGWAFRASTVTQIASETQIAPATIAASAGAGAPHAGGVPPPPPPSHPAPSSAGRAAPCPAVSPAGSDGRLCGGGESPTTAQPSSFTDHVHTPPTAAQPSSFTDHVHTPPPPPIPSGGPARAGFGAGGPLDPPPAGAYPTLFPYHPPALASSPDGSDVSVAHGRTVVTLGYSGMLELEIDGGAAHVPSPLRVLAHTGGGHGGSARLAVLLPPRGILLLSRNAEGGAGLVDAVKPAAVKPAAVKPAAVKPAALKEQQMSADRMAAEESQGTAAKIASAANTKPAATTEPAATKAPVAPRFVTPDTRGSALRVWERVAGRRGGAATARNSTGVATNSNGARNSTGGLRVAWRRVVQCPRLFCSRAAGRGGSRATGPPTGICGAGKASASVACGAAPAACGTTDSAG
eukprot:scaffold15865_cov82-Isochrysis_galbana.AAC.1